MNNSKAFDEYFFILCAIQVIEKLLLGDIDIIRRFEHEQYYQENVIQSFGQVVHCYSKGVCSEENL
jgi:hypothetical protein